MNENKNIDEFFTFDNLKNLGGSSGAVWLATGVIGFIFTKCDPYPDWLKVVALGISILISIAITTSKTRQKKMAKYYLLALLNGLLIFSTATGYNTIHNQFSISPRCNDTLKGTGLNPIQNDFNQSSIFSLLDKPWFLPKTLVEENEKLAKEKEKILSERDSVINVNKKLNEELSLAPKNERDFKNKMDSLNNVYKSIREDNINLKKGVEELRSNLKKVASENENCTNRLKKMQADYSALQNKYDNLVKECSGYTQIKKDYEKLKRDYEQLKQECSGYAQLKKDYEKLKKEYESLQSNSRYETVYNQLQECNKKLNDCLKGKEIIK